MVLVMFVCVDRTSCGVEAFWRS